MRCVYRAAFCWLGSDLPGFPPQMTESALVPPPADPASVRASDVARVSGLGVPVAGARGVRAFTIAFCGRPFRRFPSKLQLPPAAFLRVSLLVLAGVYRAGSFAPQRPVISGACLCLVIGGKSGRISEGLSFKAARDACLEVIGLAAACWAPIPAVAAHFSFWPGWRGGCAGTAGASARYTRGSPNPTELPPWPEPKTGRSAGLHTHPASKLVSTAPRPGPFLRGCALRSSLRCWDSRS